MRSHFIVANFYFQTEVQWYKNFQLYYLKRIKWYCSADAIYYTKTIIDKGFVQFLEAKECSECSGEVIHFGFIWPPSVVLLLYFIPRSFTDFFKILHPYLFSIEDGTVLFIPRLSAAMFKDVLKKVDEIGIEAVKTIL